MRLNIDVNMMCMRMSGSVRQSLLHYAINVNRNLLLDLVNITRHFQVVYGIMRCRGVAGCLPRINQVV